MKHWFRVIPMALLIAFVAQLPLNSFAQNRQRHKDKRKHAWPDTLVSVTLEGTVHYDPADTNAYFLDVDADDQVDYQLLFGPVWYVPESGAERPKNGDAIIVVGTINPKPDTARVIVFELNGKNWRDAIEDGWKHQNWCDSLETITVSGSVQIDTTHFYWHYYLNVDEDDSVEYCLGFGPHWYEPENGALRPEEGQTVTITGAVHGTDAPLHLTVLTIDDMVWRELEGPAPWAGKWLKKENQSKTKLQCPLDSSSYLEVPPGAMKGGGQHGGGMDFPDSVFCQFMQTFCDSMPARVDSMARGWYVHFSNPDGKSMHGSGRMVRFMKRLKMQLKANEIGEGDEGEDGSLAKTVAAEPILKQWDGETGQWLPVADANYDAASGTFSFEPESIATYYAVFEAPATVTKLENNIESMPVDFTLQQNYPNPFNPHTSIHFDIATTSNVKLNIYNSLGQHVKSLISAQLSAGSHQITWDGRNEAGRVAPSGMYYYRLTVNEQVQTRRMMLLK